MIAPVRLQLSRQKGFDLQAHSRAVNGLPAVNCARPGKLGNPYRIGHEAKTAEEAVYLFRRDLQAIMFSRGLYDYVERLRGRNVACFCDVGATWCHGDVYLDIFR